MPSSLGHTTCLTGKLAVPMGDTSFPLFGVVHKVVFKDAFYFVLVYPPPGGPDCHWVSGRVWPGSEGLWGRFWHGSEGNLFMIFIVALSAAGFRLVRRSIQHRLPYASL